MSALDIPRLEELTALLDDPKVALGPLDVEDLQRALAELIGARTHEAQFLLSKEQR